MNFRVWFLSKTPRERRVFMVGTWALAVILGIGGAMVTSHYRRVAVDACIAAIDDAPNVTDAAARGASIANACGVLYEKRPACRAAFVRAWSTETDPSRRLQIMVEPCVEAYCPGLVHPRPALCDQDDPTATTPATWSEFDLAAMGRSIGPRTAKRVEEARQRANVAP